MFNGENPNYVFLWGFFFVVVVSTFAVRPEPTFVDLTVEVGNVWVTCLSGAVRAERHLLDLANAYYASLQTFAP